MRVILQTLSGEFEQFEPSNGGKPSFDKGPAILAFDLEYPESHSILGRRLDLQTALESTLIAMTNSFKNVSFEEMATLNRDAIFQAKEDARNALEIARSLYQATKWVYGPRALGLRFAAWLAEKRPMDLMPGLILGFACLRQKTDHLLLSGQIAELSAMAVHARDASLQIEMLGKSDPRFQKLFTPKRIRKSFQDEASLRRFRREIEIARGDFALSNSNTALVKSLAES